MKKVLALVLAVIMVCTMAFALTIDTGNKLVVNNNGTVATITLDPDKNIDFTETYYLQVPAEYFGLLSAVKPAGKTNADVFTVTGLNGGYDTENKDNYYVPVKVADKALDGVADLTLGVFTIKYDANNYVTFKVNSANEFVVDKLIIGSMDKTATAATINEKLNAKYDIGYQATKLLADDADDYTVPTTDGWYVNNTSKAVTVGLENGVTLTVPAKTYFTFESITAGNPDATYGLTPKITKGYAVSAGTIEYKIEATNGSNDLYYAVSKAGKVYASGMTFVIEKNAVGTETGYWTLKTTDYLYGISSGTKALNVSNIPGAATPTTPGSTTNPGTGANDVVGVAAALAVVALVSGAAISLKK
jgi:hypothetical protein